jgi:hypothetical protein
MPHVGACAADPSRLIVIVAAFRNAVLHSAWQNINCCAAAKFLNARE